MVLIDKPDLFTQHKIAKMHWEAYHLKYPDLLISNNMEDYLASTLEDMTDKLLLNSTYHLVRRIYVRPEFRGQGIAKSMIKHCQSIYGTLMGYDGQFYKIGEM